MTADKILLKYGFDPGYSLYTPDQEYISIVDLLKEFASIKCEEQRRLCVNNAETEMIVWPTGNGADYVVNKDSILNAPMPEL